MYKQTDERKEKKAKGCQRDLDVGGVFYLGHNTHLFQLY